MTPDEALKVAEEALDHSHVDDCDCEDCAALAALARLRAELPKLHAIVAENLTRPRLEIVARLDAILARLEERGGDEGGGK